MSVLPHVIQSIEPTKMMIRLFLTRARHRARSCFSPALKLAPTRISVTSSQRQQNILTFITNCRVETEFRLSYGIRGAVFWKQPCSLEHRDELGVRPEALRVTVAYVGQDKFGITSLYHLQILAQGSEEESAVLGNEGQTASDSIKTHATNVVTIDLYFPALKFDDTRERISQHGGNSSKTSYRKRACSNELLPNWMRGEL